MTVSDTNRQAMEWLWDQMHKSGLKMPPDRLYLEGENDLVFLYNCGFVDTDKHSKQVWIRAFAPSKQKDGSYLLTKKEWLAKAKYRYAGPVAPPYDLSELHEGEWTKEDLAKYIKEKILPETTLPYEVINKALELAEKEKKFPPGKRIVDQSLIQEMRQLIDQNPSARRQRALTFEQVRQAEELEAAGLTPSPSSLPASKAADTGERSQFDKRPDQKKEASHKLSDLLSGGKK